ncbi:UvrD-helicase domain-containing protein [bacterium]|nr:UvrD-helicase domain-containing protein [bacterium]
MGQLDFSILNQPQKEAVTTINGSILVLAGAGSGKTRVLTYRIAYMLQKGIPASQILAVTFTNKAAGEMKERISSLVDKESVKELTVSTFHSFGVKILREKGRYAGLKNDFVIYTDSELKAMIKQIFEEEYKIKTDIPDTSFLLERILQLKSSLITPEQFKKRVNSDDSDAVAAIYEKYEIYLKKYGAVDFEDLILKPIMLFQEFPEILEYYQDKYRYILVDEYQDTNDAQFKMMDLIAQKYRNIFVVGDDDQSIYGFRGANVSNILKFTNHYHPAIEIKLEQNYRSTENILNAANSVIAQNPSRKGKKLWSALGKGELITHYITANPIREAEEISRKIASLKKKGVALKNIAIMYRSNSQSKEIELQLNTSEIPCKVVGGTSFLDRKEIKDFVAYLVALYNPFSEIHIRRVLNYPPRGIGSTSFEKIVNFSQSEKVSFFQALRKRDSFLKKSDKAYYGVAQFLEILDKHQKLLDNTIDKNDILLFLEDTSLINQIHQESKSENVIKKRVQNIMFFIDNMSYFMKEYKLTLKEYVVQFLMEPKEEKEDNEDKVTLLSIHASKGLEYPYVFLIGFNEGIMPHKKSVETGIATEIEEERRLCYVAITRAREKLILSSYSSVEKEQSTPTTGFTKKGYYRYEAIPSRFLDDIPSNLIETVDFDKNQRDVPAQEIIDDAWSKLDDIFK